MAETAFQKSEAAAGGLWIAKDPNDVLDYLINWDAAGQSFLDGDTISTSEWEVEAGLTAVSSSNTSTTATVWLSGGTAGNTYTVRNRIVTAGGRTKDQSFDVRVAEN